MTVIVVYVYTYVCMYVLASRVGCARVGLFECQLWTRVILLFRAPSEYVHAIDVSPTDMLLCFFHVSACPYGVTSLAHSTTDTHDTSS